MSDTTKEIIAVDGATGYVGSHLVAALTAKGYNVRCLVHPQAKQKDLDFLSSLGGQIVVVDLSSPNDGIVQALSGVKTAVHLVGSIAPRRGVSLSSLHQEQTKNLARAAQKAAVGKVVMITALGTERDAESTYHKTKWQAEQILKEHSFLGGEKNSYDFIVLRPSLIVGRRVGNRDSKLVKRLLEIINSKPYVPLINGGKNRIQPIFISDLIAAIIFAIESTKWSSQVVELGGPDIISMRELVCLLQSALVAHKPIVDLSPNVANAIAFICQMVQEVPVVSQDQIKMSLRDNLCQDNQLASVSGLKPTPVTEAVQDYACKQPADVKQAQMQTGNK
jgi:NADH dehydrogenase